MPRVPDRIEVVTNEDGYSRLVIDGDDFPWHVAEPGPEVESVDGTDGGWVTVTLTLFARSYADDRTGALHVADDHAAG